MANKVKLQANNELLDNYIARINAAKEAVSNLPEASEEEYNTIYIDTITPTNTDGIDGDIWIVKEA